MSIFVKLSATLRKLVPGYDPSKGLELEYPASKGRVTAADVAEGLGISAQDIKLTMINGRQQPLETALKDGDRVAYFPAVGGG